MEERGKSDVHLTEEQAAEIQRRLSNPSQETIPAEEVFRRFRTAHE